MENFDLSAASDLPPLLGEAPAFLEMLEHVSRAAPLSKPVLVVGGLAASVGLYAVATAVALGASRIVYVDHDPVYYNIDVDKIEAAITPKTKAIINPMAMISKTRRTGSL